MDWAAWGGGGGSSVHERARAHPRKERVGRARKGEADVADRVAGRGVRGVTRAGAGRCGPARAPVSHQRWQAR